MFAAYFTEWSILKLIIKHKYSATPFFTSHFSNSIILFHYFFSRLFINPCLFLARPPATLTRNFSVTPLKIRSVSKGWRTFMIITVGQFCRPKLMRGGYEPARLFSEQESYNPRHSAQDMHNVCIYQFIFE